MDLGSQPVLFQYVLNFSKRSLAFCGVHGFFSGFIPLGRVICVMTGMSLHFIDPSKPQGSERCAQETNDLKLPD